MVRPVWARPIGCKSRIQVKDGGKGSVLTRGDLPESRLKCIDKKEHILYIQCMEKRKNTSSRQKVQKLLTKSNGPITLSIVQEALGYTRAQASQLMYRLAKKGWIKKLKSGLYCVVPLESSNPSLTDENPWVIANKLFAPCYIGCWTAAHFWGLTDQLFIDTWVVTIQKVFRNKKTVSDHHYFLRQVKESYFFGLKTEWINGNKVMISDLHKTVLDFLCFPDLFTSRSIIDIFQAYLLSSGRDINILAQYAQRVENKSVLKRLGFLLELLSPESKSLIEYCFTYKSKGVSSLSTVSVCDRIVERWNLQVPKKL